MVETIGPNRPAECPEFRTSSGHVPRHSKDGCSTYGWKSARTGEAFCVCDTETEPLNRLQPGQ